MRPVPHKGFSLTSHVSEENVTQSCIAVGRPDGPSMVCLVLCIPSGSFRSRHYPFGICYDFPFTFVRRRIDNLHKAHGRVVEERIQISGVPPSSPNWGVREDPLVEVAREGGKENRREVWNVLLFNWCNVHLGVLLSLGRRASTHCGRSSCFNFLTSIRDEICGGELTGFKAGNLLHCGRRNTFQIAPVFNGSGEYFV